MVNCKEKYNDVKDTQKAILMIEKFCKFLKANKLADSKKLFSELPYAVQCLFLEYSWNIISKKSKYSESSVQTAAFVFKLFRSKEMKEKEIYKKYKNLKTLDEHYNSALKKSKKTKQKFDKEFQKHEEITKETDPKYEYFKSLKVYYTSLYEQNPSSKIAVIWLTEHGIYDDEKRKEIVQKYKKINKK